MKKALLLLLFFPLFLFGCGGGGGSSSDLGPPSSEENLDGSTDPTGSDTGTLTVTFGPQQQAQRGLVAASWVRDHARLVVRKTETVETWRDVTELYCDDEDCYDVPVLDADGNPIRELVSSVVTDTFKAISEGELDATGAGTVSIALPPDTGYTLEVLTYFADPTGLNFMLQYGKSVDQDGAPTTFDVEPGATTSVTVALTYDLAELALPGDPVVAGTNYQVSASPTDAVRDTVWHVLQTMDENDLANQWFIREGTEGASGNGPLTLQAPLSNESPAGGTTWQLWHHGQFFISNHLLKDSETSGWQNWIFGTNSAGQLNPLGSVVVIIE